MALSPKGRRRVPAYDGGQVWYVLEARNLRIHARLTQVELALAAGVGRDAIGRIERGDPVTQRIAVAIFDALNKAHNGRLKENKYVKRRGKRR
jgi:DNA-binding XRE family transcriptional regulator